MIMRYLDSQGFETSAQKMLGDMALGDGSQGKCLSLRWFESGEHPADDAQDERHAKQTERAQRVAQLTPLQAQARLLGDNRAPADAMPTVEVSLVVYHSHFL